MRSSSRQDLRKVRLLAALSIVLGQCLPAAVSAQQTADIVCSQQAGCLEGRVSSKAGAILTLNGGTANTTNATRALLLPGTYSSSMSASGTSSSANFSLLSPFLASSSSTAQTGFSLSPSTSSFSISQLSGLSAYSSSLFSGESSFAAFNDSYIQNATTAFTPLSLLMSQDVYAVARVPVRGRADRRIPIFASVPDTTELPLLVQQGSWSIEELQGNKCSPACASGGLCSLDGKCLCVEGFTGQACDACQAGRFGPKCTACPDCPNGTCDSGISGTGRCVPSPLVAAASSCRCTNGVCASAGSCVCSPGWADALGGSRCSVCATGYYASQDASCLACGAGCTACASGSGTCSTCQAGLQVSAEDPRQCTAQRFLPPNGTAFTTCQTGFYLSDAAAGTCTACSGSCAECFGPQADNCTACPAGRGLLQGTCVSVDAGTGICDGSALSAGTALAWLYNNESKVCDPLPAGCTAGRIDNFSSSATTVQAQCTACLGGLTLHAGTCVSDCPSGFFSTGGTAPICQACSSGCATCSGSADFCTSCPSGSLVVNGSCQPLSSCPSGTFQPDGNSTAACASCHPDCAACSSAFDSCTSCPPSRPALISGKCYSTCPAGQYLDESSGSCKSCDGSCATCAGAGSAQCMSCSGATVLQSGSCVPADCTAPISGLGVCLKDFAQLSKSRTSLTDDDQGKKLPVWVYVLIGVGVVLLIALAVTAYRYRAMKKRAAKTAGFTRRKGLAGFIDLFRRQKPTGAASKDYEANDKAGLAGGPVQLHNHIELQARSPIPPPYDFTQPPLPHPAFLKQQYLFPSSPSESAYSQAGEHSMYALRPVWPPEKHDRMPSPSHWPPHSRQDSASTSAAEDGHQLRPLILRGSSSTASLSSTTKSKPADRRYGSVGLSRDFEDTERQKTLDLLTGQSSRRSKDRIESGLL